MKERSHILLVLASAGMTLSWFYAWNSFIMLYLSENPIPVPEAALVLTMASLITSIHRFRGWRWISVLLLNLAGFLFSLSLLVYACNDFSSTFWGLNWTQEFLHEEKGLMEWITIIHIVFWSLFLWIYGIRLIYTPIDNRSVGLRVDIGLTFFLILLLTKLLIRYKGGTNLDNHSITLLFIAFVVFALFSMGMVRTIGDDHEVNTKYLSNIGAVLSFSFFVIIFGGGLVMLFLPGLISGAEFSYDLLKTVSRPVGNVLIFLLRFIFSLGPGDSLTEERQSGDSAVQTVLAMEADNLGLIEMILLWLLIGAMILATLILIGMLAPILCRWLVSRIRLLIELLLSRTPGGRVGNNPWDILIKTFNILKAAVLLFMEIILKAFQSSQGSEYYYFGLLRWGYRSGLPHLLWETPREYGSRLALRFPFLRLEIDLIVDIYNYFLYGGVPPDGKRLVHLRKAWKRLRNPLFWPVRLKAKITGSLG